MISCPSCKHQELSGAIFCSKCGSQLAQFDRNVATSNIETTGIQDFEKPFIPTFPTQPEEDMESEIAFHILSNGEIIHMQGKKDEFTFGRSTKGQTIIPDIDLSPYQAYEAGVSRLHANINITDQNIIIKDLGSANGTRVNGTKIQPHEEHALSHGDILTFGKLKVQILIREQA